MRTFIRERIIQQKTGLFSIVLIVDLLSPFHYVLVGLLRSLALAPGYQVKHLLLLEVCLFSSCLRIIDIGATGHINFVVVDNVVVDRLGVIELIHAIDEFLAEIIQYLAGAVEEVNRVDFIITTKDLGLNLIVVPAVGDSHSLGTQEDTGALLKLTAAIANLNRKAQLLVDKDLGDVAQIVGKIIDHRDLLTIPLGGDVVVNPLL